MCSLGIEPTTFCAANTMLYHWATGTHECQHVLWHTEAEHDPLPSKTGPQGSIDKYWHFGPNLDIFT